MKIPCIEEKCITWPMCRNSEVITCPTLNKLCCHIDEQAESSEHLFRVLNIHFPNLHTVLGAAQKPAHIDMERALRSTLTSHNRSPF